MPASAYPVQTTYNRYVNSYVGDGTVSELSGRRQRIVESRLAHMELFGGQNWQASGADVSGADTHDPIPSRRPCKRRWGERNGRTIRTG
jgi:hypothetical protein